MIRISSAIFLASALGFQPTALRANDHLSCLGIINGGETIWRGTREAARRNAREKWRDAVEHTPGLGQEYSNWGWANRPDIGDGSDGYYCRTVSVWFDKWHKCSAWAEPCNFDPNQPRAAELSPSDRQPDLDLAREEAPLTITSTALDIERITRRGICPAAFVVTASITGTGTQGTKRLTLKDDADGEESTTLRPEDFIATGEGKRVAKIDFVRTFDAATERRYRISLGSGSQSGEPQRTNPGVSLSVSCRTEGIGGLTVAPEPPRD